CSSLKLRSFKASWKCTGASGLAGPTTVTPGPNGTMLCGSSTNSWATAAHGANPSPAAIAATRSGRRSGPQIGATAPSSPLTKSGSSDSLRLRRFGRVIGDGDGAVGGGSGRLDGDVGGDASLAGTRVLRPAAGAAAGSRFRRVRGAGLQ